MTGRRRAAELSAWCRKISIHTEHSQRLREKPGEEGWEIWSFSIFNRAGVLLISCDMIQILPRSLEERDAVLAILYDSTIPLYRS